MHDIGKDLVVMMLESSGFKVIDLGVDISPESFLNSVKQNKAHICAISSLLTTTMPSMKKTMDLLKKELAHDHVKTIIGGAPVSQKFAEDIGADGFAHDAGAAVKKEKALICSTVS
jgi:5-methyltetrahydrofolate--homocysteine methyltransferase